MKSPTQNMVQYNSITYAHNMI